MSALVKISACIRKAVLEYVAILSEWENSNSLSEKVLSSLVNAAQRRIDYAEARGKLGVISDFEGAEHILQVVCIILLFLYLAFLVMFLICSCSDQTFSIT